MEILKKKMGVNIQFLTLYTKTEKYTELWDGIKNEIETINGGKNGEYGKDVKLEVKFDADDNQPLNKPLKLCMLTITARCILKKIVNFIYNFFQTGICMSYKNGNKHKTNEK